MRIFRGEFFLYQLDKEDHPAVVERRAWGRRDFHYDNVASAMLTLFAVQTGEGWPLWVDDCCRINISINNFINISINSSFNNSIHL